MQGLEKLSLAMHGRSYTGLIIAENQSPQTVQVLRKNYQQLYSKLSPLQKVQISDNQSLSSSKSRPFWRWMENRKQQ